MSPGSVGLKRVFMAAFSPCAAPTLDPREMRAGPGSWMPSRATNAIVTAAAPCAPASVRPSRHAIGFHQADGESGDPVFLGLVEPSGARFKPGVRRLMLKHQHAGPALLAVTLLSASAPAQTQTSPRPLGPPDARFSATFSTISGARELPDGRVLVTDFRASALYLIDLRRGTTTTLGRSGSGPDDYRRPGGIYSGPGDTLLVVDRGRPQAIVVTPAGELIGMRSIAFRNHISLSNRDVDRQRVNARGFVYFTGSTSMRTLARTGRQDSIPLLKLDPVRQALDTIARLRPPDARILSVQEKAVQFRTVLLSPADGWGVAADGRVAVVRAVPYRVDWIGTDGRMIQGPSPTVDAVPVTEADRVAAASQRLAGQNGATPSGGMTGVKPSTSGLLFAETKPAFDPDDIIVAPDGRVFVGRHLPADAEHVLYDVFDGRGVRVDQIELPARSRIIGFGAKAIFVAERDDEGRALLRRYAF